MEFPLPIIAYTLGVFLTIVLVVYNWLYLKELRKARSYIGISPPKYLIKLLRVTVIISVGTVVVLLLFMLLEAM